MGITNKNKTRTPEIRSSRFDLTFLTTLLLTVSGWGLVYLVNSLVAAPIVEYSSSLKTQDRLKIVNVTIENISHTSRIDNLHFGLGSRARSPVKFIDARLEATAPAAEGEESKAEIKRGEIEAHFTIKTIHPKQRFNLIATYEGNHEPELRLLNATGPVLLYQRGPVTFSVKNLIHVIATVTISAFIVLIIIVYPIATSSFRSSRKYKN